MGDAGDAVETADLEDENVGAALAGAGGDLEDERAAAAAGLLRHGNARHPEAAPFDEADHADHGTFGDIIFDGEKSVHRSSSIISMLDLFGGTSGQTLVRGSIRAWQRIGPSVFSSRSIAPGTSAR